MPEEFDRQAILDGEHLKLLSWGYYVSAGFAALYALFAVAWLLMATLFFVPAIKAAQQGSESGQPFPTFVIWIFAGMGLGFFAVMLTAAILKYLTGRNLGRRKSRTFCMVIAALSCLEFPYGTLLGVLTFVVLGRDSVVRTFAPSAGVAPAPDAAANPHG